MESNLTKVSLLESKSSSSKQLKLTPRGNWKKALTGKGKQSCDEPLFTADLNSVLHWRKLWGLWHEAKNSRSRAGDKDEWLPETQFKVEEFKKTVSSVCKGFPAGASGGVNSSWGRISVLGSALGTPYSHLRYIFKRFSTPEKLVLP